MSAARIGRAFSPENGLGNPTQGNALGWHEDGPLALKIQTTSDRPRRILSSAPTAQSHTSLGHRPRNTAPNSPRAFGPLHTSEGQRPSTRASPQEWNRPTKQRAEGPFHGIAGCAIAHHFRGVTKMVPQLITQRNPEAEFNQRSSRQGFLDDSNRRRSRVTEESSVTAKSAAYGVFTPRSQGKATVKESLTVQVEQLRRGTAEESSVVQTAGGKGIDRAFSPREIVSTGFPGRCPRLVWLWAFGPETQTAPTARLHTSLGQRPKVATPTRIEG